MKLQRLGLAAACAAVPFFASAPLRADALTTHAPAQRALGNAGSRGYSNPIDPAPKVVRPNTTSCVVTLATNQAFANFTPFVGPYSPPPASQCPGPWSKVVLDWNVSVSGVQFDRLGAVWLGATEIFHFTTSEPPGAPIHWHLEKDVTEYAQTLATAQNVTISLGNLVNGTYTGIYYVTASLTFYEPGPKWPAATTPDLVAPIAAGGSPPWFTLNTPSDQASATLSLPSNIERAELEVYATGHGCDEFWYAQESTAYEQSIGQACGGTAYRELDVTVDGMLAAVIVPFPYIYTGGIDPSLWLPIPAHDALNVPPYRVNLTPFAGVLTDGIPHTIAVSVDNNSGYWVCDADLLVTEDHGRATTTGALTALSNGPKRVERYNESHLNSAGGTAEYRATHFVNAQGYIDTSRGRITTSVSQDWSFADHQSFANSGAYFFYIANTLGTTTEAVASRNFSNTTTRTVTYPLAIRSPVSKPLGIDQAWYQTINGVTNGNPSFAYGEDVIRASQAGSTAHTTEHYVLQRSGGYCYDHTFAATNLVLTSKRHNNCH